METQLGIVRIPHRFEALQSLVGKERLGEVLLESPKDTDAAKRAIAEVRSAGQGKLLFVLAPSGTGKTSFAESLRVYLADVVGEVVTPPPDYEVPLLNLPSWLSKHIPPVRQKVGGRVVVVNLDGREIPQLDAATTQTAMVNLNAFMRKSKDLLALWPVVNTEFADQAIASLNTAGAGTALAQQPKLQLQGIDKVRYFDALRLILATTSAKLADAAVGEDEARELVAGSSTIGDYLQSVHNLVVAHFDLGTLGTTLPRVYIVVASGSEDVTQECRMLRRGDQFLLDADRLLQYSQANVADDWRQRGQENARRSLPFICSLFEARLLSLSASSVVNACAFSPDQGLREAVRRHYPSPVSSNAANSLKNSALRRALDGQADVGPGTPLATAQISKAYAEIQAMSKAKHRAINEAIVGVLTGALHVDLPGLSFEHCPFTDRGLQMDVHFKRGERPETLEFTYRADASGAIIATYVLTKLQDYARDYRLI